MKSVENQVISHIIMEDNGTEAIHLTNAPFLFVVAFFGVCLKIIELTKNLI